MVDLIELNEKVVNIQEFERNFRNESYGLDLWPKYDDETDEANEANDYNYYDRLEANMLNWINENCENQVLYHGDLQFYFKSQTDRLAFKIRFG